MIERFVANVTVAKALLRATDDEIAVRGGYNSRQVVAARTSGRTSPTVEDLYKFGLGLGVPGELLIMPSTELVTWIAAAQERQFPAFTVKGQAPASETAPAPTPSTQPKRRTAKAGTSGSRRRT